MSTPDPSGPTTGGATARSAAGDVHRRLDALFAGVEPSDETQDLKEEIRANLVARVAELESQGRPDALDRAFAELGDVRELLDEAESAPSTPGAAAMAAAHRNRVRPDPGFVVRTVLLALLAAAALVLLVVGLTPLLPAPSGVLVAAAVVFGAALGVVTADALAQETSTNHPMPRGRAWRYGVGTGVLLAGLALAPVVILGLPIGWIALPAALAVAAIAELSHLGATQTNRRKAWAVTQARAAEYADRFTEDPAAAARFGIYTVIIWIVAAVAAVVLGVTVGWLWAPLAAIGGFVVMMLTLARMLFGGERR